MVKGVPTTPDPSSLNRSQPSSVHTKPDKGHKVSFKKWFRKWFPNITDKEANKLEQQMLMLVQRRIERERKHNQELNKAYRDL